MRKKRNGKKKWNKIKSKTSCFEELFILHEKRRKLDPSGKGDQRKREDVAGALPHESWHHFEEVQMAQDSPKD